MTSMLPDRLWDELDTVLMHPGLDACKRVRTASFDNAPFDYENLHWEILGNLANLVCTGVGGWEKPAHLFFQHNSVSSKRIGGLLIPTPGDLVEWMQSRASDGVGTSRDDELASLLLLLFAAEQIPPWYPRIDPRQAELFSRSLEVSLLRGCRDAWRMMALYLATNRDVFEYAGLAGVWEQLELEEADPRRALVYRASCEFNRIRFSSSETVADHTRAIAAARQLLAVLEPECGLPELDPQVDTGRSQEQGLLETLRLRCQMEVGLRSRRLDDGVAARDAFGAVVARGLRLAGCRPSPDAQFPGWRGVVLAASREAIDVISELSDMGGGTRDFQKAFEALSCGRDNSWELSVRAEDRGANAHLNGNIDEAERCLSEAFYRCWNLHCLSCMERLHSSLGRLYLARHSLTADATEATGFALSAAIQGATACDRKLVEEARRALETRSLVSAMGSKEKLRRAVFGEVPLRRKEKVGLAYLLAHFIDYFEENDFDTIVALVGAWTRDAWGLDTSQDVSRSSIAVLHAACRVLPGLANPEEGAKRIVAELRKTVKAHRNVGHVILEVAKVAEAMVAVPRAVTKGAAKDLLEILREYNWEPGTIHERAWISIVRPATVHSLLSKEPGLASRVAAHLPPVTSRVPTNGRASCSVDPTESAFVEHAIQFRMYLGIPVEEEVLSSFVQEKTERYERDYLAPRPHQSFPGRFHTYVSCVLQTPKTTQRQILQTLAKIVARKDLMPVVRGEALSALWWFVEAADVEGVESSSRYDLISQLDPAIPTALLGEMLKGPDPRWSEDPFSGQASRGWPLDLAAFLFRGCESGATLFQSSDLPGIDISTRVVDWLREGSSSARELFAHLVAYQFGKAAAKEARRSRLGLDLVMALTREPGPVVRQQLHRGLAMGLMKGRAGMPLDAIGKLIVECCVDDAASSHRGLAQEATNALVAIIRTTESVSNETLRSVRLRIGEWKQGDLRTRSLVRTAEMLLAEETES